MAAALRYDWETIRAEYEVGATMGELSRKYGVTKAAISQRAKKEGWLQDATGAVRRRTDAKLNGILNTVNSQKREAAIEAAADRNVALLQKHIRELEEEDEFIRKADESHNFDDYKIAKIRMETVKLKQEAERKAYGITDVTETRSTVDATQKIVIDGANMDRAGIEAIVDQAYRLEAAK